MNILESLNKIAHYLKESDGPSHYWHTSSFKYNPGDIIKPYWSMDKGDAKAEDVIEKVRQKHYSNYPSRLNSVFCWPDFEEASKDASRYIESGRQRYLYKVAPLGAHKPVNVMAYEKTISAPNTMKGSWAEKYWRPSNHDKKEILAENGVKILSAMDLF